MNRTQRLEALYAKLPTIQCTGRCYEACGPIQPSRFEYERMGNPHWPDGQLNCPLLIDKRCSVYEVRPLVCRLFGVVEGMPCPFGCKPDRVPSFEEETAWLEEWKLISGTLAGPNLQHIADKLAHHRPLIAIRTP